MQLMKFNNEKFLNCTNWLDNSEKIILLLFNLIMKVTDQIICITLCTMKIEHALHLHFFKLYPCLRSMCKIDRRVASFQWFKSKNIIIILTFCHLTLCCTFDPLSFDLLLFDSLSFDPLLFYPMSFDLLSVNHVIDFKYLKYLIVKKNIYILTSIMYGWNPKLYIQMWMTAFYNLPCFEMLTELLQLIHVVFELVVESFSCLFHKVVKSSFIFSM